MATLLDILERKYVGRVFTMGDPDIYAGIEWLDALAIPTEAEIRAFSAEVDKLMLDEIRDGNREDAIISFTPGDTLKVLDPIVLAVKDLQTLLLGVNPELSAAITALADRIQSAKDTYK